MTFIPRTEDEEERRKDIQAAVRRCLEGYKPQPVKEELETQEEKALRRKYILEDARIYGRRQ